MKHFLELSTAHMNGPTAIVKERFLVLFNNVFEHGFLGRKVKSS